MEEHPIFTTDPGTWVGYLHKEVVVTVDGGEQHTGRVYTIDPVSQSVALMKSGKDDDKVDVEIIMGHSVKSMKVINDSIGNYKTAMDALFKPKPEAFLKPSELKERKEKLKSWFLKNRLPVKDTGRNHETLSISDAVTIESPYQAENCFSTNEIILGKIQGLIKTMPNDIEEW